MKHKYNLKRNPALRGARYAPRYSMTPTTRPPSVDLRAKFPPAFDQGQEGSCGPNSADALMCFYHPDVAHNAGGFSRQQIYYDVRALEGTTDHDAGVETVDLFKVLLTKGAAPENLWPYTPADFTTPPPASVEQAASNYKIASYNQLASEEDFLNCLADGLPFVLGIVVYQSLESDLLARTGVYGRPNTASENNLGGHDVCVVGYDTNFFNNPDFIRSGLSKSQVNSTALLIRNSWGTDWGLQGYFWMPIDYAASPITGGDAWVGKVNHMSVSSKPTADQIKAAVAAGRKALNDYSAFDSAMVPDDALEVFCEAVVTAALNVTPSTGDK